MDVNMGGRQCPQLANAVGWALYALEPAEEHAIRAHLLTCAQCRATVREAEETSAHLGAAFAQHEPPPALRERLLAAIAEAPRVTVRPVPLAAARRVRHWRTRGLLVAAAAVVVALGVTTTVLGVQVSTLTSQQQAQAAGEAMVRSIVNDPAAKRAVLTNAAGKPTAMLITSSVGAVVTPLAMTPNSADDQYVVWGLEPSGPRALASFDVTAGSVGPKVVSWPASANGLTRFAISVEPGRTLPTTPSNVIASGSDA